MFRRFTLHMLLQQRGCNDPRADPEGAGETGGSGPPLEFWQKNGYQIRDWDRLDITQHLCKLQS